MDECGFNLRLSPTYGYAPSGVEVHIMVPTQRGINIFLLLAISISRVLCWDLQSGAYNFALFSLWCYNKLFPALGDHQSVVIMDNARIHHTSEATAAFAGANCRLEYLPPYSPQLDPIESFLGC